MRFFDPGDRVRIMAGSPRLIGKVGTIVRAVPCLLPLGIRQYEIRLDDAGPDDAYLYWNGGGGLDGVS